jgi:hypothetical protein
VDGLPRILERERRNDVATVMTMVRNSKERGRWNDHQIAIGFGVTHHRRNRWPERTASSNGRCTVPGMMPGL